MTFRGFLLGSFHTKVFPAISTVLIHIAVCFYYNFNQQLFRNFSRNFNSHINNSLVSEMQKIKITRRLRFGGKICLKSHYEFEIILRYHRACK